MRKFECKYCKKNCILTVKEHDMQLRLCPYSSFPLYANWHEVKEDSAENEQFGNSEQLPDWVKVGAIGYDDMNNEYFEVIEVNNDSFRAKYIDSSDSCSGLYFNEFCSEARKRPFNEKEMRALVGKKIEHENNAHIVVSYTILCGFTPYLKIGEHWQTAIHLMNNNYTIDGKPCYVLEHLENGEWVE